MVYVFTGPTEQEIPGLTAAPRRAHRRRRSERVAWAKAKAAYVRGEKARIRAEREEVAS